MKSKLILLIVFVFLFMNCEKDKVDDCNDFNSSYSLLDDDNDGLTNCEETTGIDNPNTFAKPNGFSDPNNPFLGKKDTTINIGGSLNEAIQCVIKTKDGGIVCVGYTQSNDKDIKIHKGNNDFWVIKFDENLKQVWNKTYGGSKEDVAFKVIESKDGALVISGYTFSDDLDVESNKGQKDIWVIKINSEGDLIWNKSFGFEGDEESFSIIETKDGGYFVCGYIDVTASGGKGNSLMFRNTLHGVGDYWLLKLSVSGELEWSKYFGGSNNDRAYDVKETLNGDFVIVGTSESDDFDITSSKGSYDYWMIKVSNEGEMIEEYSFGGTEIDNCYSLFIDNDNNFLLTGNTFSLNGNVINNHGYSDVWIIKTNDKGEVLWKKTYGGSAFDSASSIKQLKNGNYIVTGSSRSFDKDVDSNKGQNDIWLLIINKDGEIIWNKTFGGTGFDIANDVVVLDDNSIIVVGESNSKDFDIPNNKGFTDAVLVKIK